MLPMTSLPKSHGGPGSAGTDILEKTSNEIVAQSTQSEGETVAEQILACIDQRGWVKPRDARISWLGRPLGGHTETGESPQRLLLAGSTGTRVVCGSGIAPNEAAHLGDRRISMIA